MQILNIMIVPENSSSASIDEILDFWFGKAQTASEVSAEKSAFWWSKNDQIDRAIINRFALTSAAAANGEFTLWSESPRGLLALIICTDQFPRNMHRNTEQAFAYDTVALTYAKQGVNSGTTRHLKPIEQVFAYLPFEHSEDLGEQQRSVALYQMLVKNAAPNEAELFNTYLKFAYKHYEIIKRFGRFPHRNLVLGRASTEEELAFLKQPGSSF